MTQGEENALIKSHTELTSALERAIEIISDAFEVSGEDYFGDHWAGEGCETADQPDAIHFHHMKGILARAKEVQA